MKGDETREVGTSQADMESQVTDITQRTIMEQLEVLG